MYINITSEGFYACAGITREAIGAVGYLMSVVAYSALVLYLIIYIRRIH